jgi:valyl-tRNA synthetase
MCHLLYDFTWHDFCDWYIEAKKLDLYGDEDPQAKSDALNLLSYLLGSILKLLHPIMPFITEEIWSALREKVAYPGLIDDESIMHASYPQAAQDRIDTEVSGGFDLVKDVIVALRTIRSENNVPPEKKGTAVIVPVDEHEEQWLASQIPLINMFGRLSGTTVSLTAKKPGFAGQSVVRGVQVFLELEGLIDRQVEIDRLTKEIERQSGLANGTRKRLDNESFVSKAPAEVVERERSKLEGIELNLEKLEKSLKALKE